MEQVLDFFRHLHPVLAALYAGLFTWALTAAGAALVFPMNRLGRGALDGMLGFTGGVMVAASCFGLLGPAIDSSAGEGFVKVTPAAIGFILGAIFIYGVDKVMPHLHLNFREDEKEGIKTTWHRTSLLVSAITIHNVPEGLAVGVLFGAAAGAPDLLNEAIILSIAIAIQNFPEGIAVSMPLKREGISSGKSWFFGQASAAVEPVAAVIGAVAVTTFEPLLPYALAFAAGAMIYVVIEEVVPETQRDKFTDVATLGFIIGFTLMMVLDVGLG